MLTGGGAAEFYAPRDYKSSDLDFVLDFHTSDSKTRDALETIGFVRAGRILAHPDTPFTVEFPPGPLGVGDDTISAWDTVQKGEYLLHLITPTDSVRDRLAAYLFWNDLQSLHSALAVAAAQRERTDLALIEDWCKREREPDKYAEFARRLERR